MARYFRNSFNPLTMRYDDGTSPSTQWRYVIAAVPFVQIAWLSLFAVVLLPGYDPFDLTFAGFEGTTAVLVALFVPTALLTLALPVAVYRDVTYLEEAGTIREDSDRHRFVMGALAGLFVPGLSALVSTYYLYRRGGTRRV